MQLFAELLRKVRFTMITTSGSFGADRRYFKMLALGRRSFLRLTSTIILKISGKNYLHARKDCISFFCIGFSRRQLAFERLLFLVEICR